MRAFALLGPADFAAARFPSSSSSFRDQAAKQAKHANAGRSFSHENMLTSPQECRLTYHMQSPSAVWPPMLLQRGLFLCLGEEQEANSGQLEVQYHQRTQFNSRDIEDGSQLHPAISNPFKLYFRPSRSSPSLHFFTFSAF